MTQRNEPFAMHWAQQCQPLGLPPGSYDPRTQRWTDCSKAGTGANTIATAEQQLRSEQGRRTALVVTSCFDPHADAVVAALATRGVEVIRLNAEDWLSTHTVSWQFCQNQSTSFTISDHLARQVSIPAGVCAGYYRTPARVAPHVDTGSAAGQSFSSCESAAFLDSLYSHDGIRWVSAPHLIRRAEAKVPQLELAMSLGLRIPRTLVTNSPQDAYRFAKDLDFDVAVKPLMTSDVEGDGTMHEIYTRRLARADVEDHIESVRLAPTVLQEYVQKATEIRVTFIGCDTFATEIDSQSVEGAETDWRQVNPFAVPHRPISLPESLIAVLRRFLNHYGLSFGAFDLIKTPNGDYVFLENNPNGQWYWLEVLTGQPMAASMARLLTNDQ